MTSYRKVMDASWNALSLVEEKGLTNESLDLLMKSLQVLRRLQHQSPMGIDEVNDFEECLEDLV